MIRTLIRAFPLALFALLCACEGNPSAPEPAQVQALTGSGQSGLTEAMLAGELVAKVSDARGKGISGVAVAWSVAPDAGSLSSASTTTDAAGEARVRWTLGTGAGTFTATATVAGLAPATFTATATLPQPASLQVVSGSGQAGAPGGALADSIAVRVVSAEGRAVANATVTWAVTGGAGTLAPGVATTNAAGIAKARWTLGTPGPQSATATVLGLAPATFSAYAVPVASVALSPAQPVVVRGSTLQLTAVPRDSAGNPLSGRAVVWASQTPGAATVSAAGVVTGTGRGTATITATSEGRTGSVVVTVAQRPPRIAGLEFTPDPVDVSTADADVRVRFSVLADMGVSYLYIMLQSTRGDPPGGQYHPCSTREAPVSGSSEQGVWECTVRLPRGSAAGAWTVNVASVTDSAGTVANHGGAELAAQGVDVTFQVQSAAEDVTAPTLVSLAAPAVVALSDGRKRIDFSFTGADAGTGMSLGSASVSRSGSGGQGCSADPGERPGAPSALFRSSVVLSAQEAPGTWNIAVSLVDVVGNSRSYSSAGLQAAGFPHQVTINP